MILILCDSETLQVQARSCLYLSAVRMQTSASMYVIPRGSRPDGACDVHRVGRCRMRLAFDACHELCFMVCILLYFIECIRWLV